MPGPYRIRLRVEEGRLAIELTDEAGALLDTIRMGLGRFRRPIRDYFLICDCYFKAVRADSPRGIEAIDMARRGQHNAGAELLQECLKDQVEMDFDTARRLFTLICVLHIKATPAAVDAHDHSPASHAACILSDKWIREAATTHGMIEPFVESAAARRLHQLRPLLLRL